LKSCKKDIEEVNSVAGLLKEKVNFIYKFLKELKINLVQSVKNQEMENEGLEREINRINKIDRLKV
jgi:hypothetical protein